MTGPDKADAERAAMIGVPTTATEPESPNPIAAIELTEEGRSEIIEKLSLLVPTVDSVTWALLWLSDLNRLKWLLNLDKGLIWAVLSAPNHRSLLYWAGRARPTEDPEASYIPRRSEEIRATCLERDEYCAITKKDEPLEVAHIYPYSLMTRSGSERDAFWSMLCNFWDADQIQRWKRVVLGPEGTEVLQNMLCLSHDCHGLWGMARFALQPVELSEDQKVLKMRFFWLPAAKFSKSVPVTRRPSLPSDLRHVGKQTKLFNCATSAQICSGDIITIKTTDPENYPLPSLEILGLQWTLTRVLAMSGAADIDPEELDSDSDEEQGIDTQSVDS
ncbi:hypothetical protein BJX61DRAFT_537260 [Aspergillus egyptiacus]|nr:hypothetical protein BJX61DRAFT_537260 [Aspergillus egyptiacus]